MAKKSKQYLYEILPDYMFEATPEVQKRYSEADQKGLPRPNFYFVRLLSPSYRNWVINLEDVPDAMNPNAEMKVGFSIFRVPKDVTDEFIHENKEQIKEHVTRVIQRLLTDAIAQHKAKNKKKN